VKKPLKLARRDADLPTRVKLELRRIGVQMTVVAPTKFHFAHSPFSHAMRSMAPDMMLEAGVLMVQ
jgi:hypothetical protein